MSRTRMEPVPDVATVVGDHVAQRESALLAPYAMHSRHSAGRKFPEPAHPYRAPYARDRDRIVHSAAYRRLSGKTQVFMGEMGDYHRTRLTHTLEVASIARTVGRALRLNEDLIEALALAHDIGHPPFGHAGEDTLDACLAEEGGFEHNRQALRIVEQLECRSSAHAGLNLTFEVLEGQLARAAKTEDRPSPLLEAQVVEAADSVAYDTHDADDALELGLLDLEELLEVPLWREAAARVHERFSDLDVGARRRAIVHELIDWQVDDLLEHSRRRIREAGVACVAQVRSAGPLIGVGTELAHAKKILEDFLHHRVYRHPQILKTRRAAQASLRVMFEGYVARPELLPEKFRRRIARDGVPRAVGDYLAGMTDRFARSTFERLFER